jgi:hypothetical protein
MKGQSKVESEKGAFGNFHNLLFRLTLFHTITSQFFPLFDHININIFLSFHHKKNQEVKEFPPTQMTTHVDVDMIYVCGKQEEEEWKKERRH